MNGFQHDAEGFPEKSLVLSHSHDEESGEITNNEEDGNSEVNFQALQYFPPRPNYINQPQIHNWLSYREDIRLNKLFQIKNYIHHNCNGRCDSGDTSIPLKDPNFVSNTVTIPIWREFFLSESAVDPKIKSFPEATIDLIRMHFHNINLQELMKKFFTPKLAQKIGYFLEVSLSMFMGCQIDLIFYHALVIHNRIHNRADSLGLKLKFIGNALEGPFIYMIRQFSCQHCNQERTARRFMKHFQESNKGRRKMAQLRGDTSENKKVRLA